MPEVRGQESVGLDRRAGPLVPSGARCGRRCQWSGLRLGRPVFRCFGVSVGRKGQALRTGSFASFLPKHRPTETPKHWQRVEH